MPCAAISPTRGRCTTCPSSSPSLATTTTESSLCLRKTLQAQFTGEISTIVQKIGEYTSSSSLKKDKSNHKILVDRSESQKLRNLGNQVYQKNRLPEALEYYSQVTGTISWYSVFLNFLRASAWPPILSPLTPTWTIHKSRRTHSHMRWVGQPTEHHKDVDIYESIPFPFPCWTCMNCLCQELLTYHYYISIYVPYDVKGLLQILFAFSLSPPSQMVFDFAMYEFGWLILIKIFFRSSH